MSDILDNLARVRTAFLACDMRPPTVLQLETHEEGVRFLRELRRQDAWTAVVGSGALGSVVECADGSAYMQVEVMGMKVRWPANRIATPDGSWSYV